jgi:serine/threonine protein kinase
MSVSHTVVTRFCADCRQSYPYKEEHICPVAPAAPAPVQKPEDELLHTVLGERYRIESFVQRGGMGTVYLARHIVLDKPVAIKVLNDIKDEVAQKRFLLEAKSACHVNHEHIVNITDYGVLADGRPYLVMEYLQGQALDALIAKGPLPVPRVCRIAEQIALGLQAVHDKGILHRDLKPGNVFLLERHRRDYVKILDFGIAKVVTDRPSETGPDGLPYRPTQEGMVLGTAEYLSPEQALGEPLDHRVDQYALGCILFEMLTGEVPWKGTSAMATVVKRLNEEPPSPRQRRPDLNLPPSLDAVVVRALSRTRDKRYPSMNDLAAALVEVLDAMGLPVSESSGSFSQSFVASILDTQPRSKLNAQTLPANPSPSSSTLRTPLERPTLRTLMRPWLLPMRWRIVVILGFLTVILGVSLGLALRLVGTGTTFVKQTTVPPQNPVPPEAPRATVDVDLGQVATTPPVMPSGEDKDQAIIKSAEVEPATKVILENAGTVELTIACTKQPTCIITPNNICPLTIGAENGRCEATATGRKSQSFTFRDLRLKAKNGTIRKRIALDAKVVAGEAKL